MFNMQKRKTKRKKNECQPFVDLQGSGVKQFNVAKSKKLFEIVIPSKNALKL